MRLYIDGLVPDILTWDDPYLVTLTSNAQRGLNLDKWMGGMITALIKIRKKYDQKYRNGNGPKLIGIRSLECNFNPIKKTYNPHFHILTANREIARTIKKEWCQLWTPQFALPFLQKIRKVKNTETDIIETIKYGAKIFTDPTMKKGRKKTDHMIFAAGLHQNFKAMEGHRLFGTFGFKLPKRGTKEDSSILTPNAVRWIYDIKVTDWVNVDTGQVMTKYSPDWELENLMKHNINDDLE